MGNVHLPSMAASLIMTMRILSSILIPTLTSALVLQKPLSPQQTSHPQMYRTLLRRSPTPQAAADTKATADTEAIISFSPSAMSQLISLRDQDGSNEICVRMGVRAGGCSGMSYVMDVMQAAEIDDSDTVIEFDDGIKCVIDPKSLMFLYGLKLDYSNALIGGGFSFHNPNAEQTCGCGKSFDV